MVRVFSDFDLDAFDEMNQVEEDLRPATMLLSASGDAVDTGSRCGRRKLAKICTAMAREARVHAHHECFVDLVGSGRHPLDLEGTLSLSL